MGYYSWNEAEYIATIRLEGSDEDEVIIKRTVRAESADIALAVTAMHVGVAYPNHRVVDAHSERKYDN